MGDNHIIRVIIQGYDRLSNVMRDAANRSGPALDGMRDRLKRVQNESKGVNTSLAATGANIDSIGDKVEKSRVRLERFTQSWNKLKASMRERLGRPAPLEDPDEMFSRLRREGNAPRVRRQDGGLPMFQSRADFVDQENKRRALAAQNAELERQGTLIGRLETKTREFTSKFEGASPIDDFVRGFKSFTRAEEEDQDTIRQQQIKNQKALAEFDKDVAERRRAKISENESDRREGESLVRVREENVRKGLASIDKELDDFIIKENLRLKQKKIDIKVELAPDDADRRTASSKSKKVTDEERDAARKRIAESKKAINSQIALEEAASQQRISQKRHETAEINREALAGIQQGEREELAVRAAAGRKRLQIFDSERKEERLKLRQSQAAEIADLPALIRKRNDAESNAIKNLKIGDRDATPIEKLGARASRGVSDFFRGFTGAREKFKEFEGDARKVQNVAAQIGARFGDAARDVNKLVNVRWALLLSLIGVLGTVVTQLAGALVAVASSAILAAAALGGALVTGVLAAVPVVGLLAAAFHGLSDAMKVVDLRSQARTKSPDDIKARADAQRRAAEQLADAQHGLKDAQEGVTAAERDVKRAHEGVTDANYDLAQSIRGVADAQRNLRKAHEAVTDAEKEQKDSVKALADARRDARRAIVDAALEERDARLSVKEAELGVLDAKKRLADFEKKQRADQADLNDAQDAVREAQARLTAARAQGDAVEIATASSALAVARGNVGSIQDQISQTANQQKELEAGVERANLTEKQAKLRRDRAIADNKRVKNEGVEGSPEVKSAVDRVTRANRNYRDSVQGVKDAIQSVSDAEHNVTQSRRGVRDAIQGVVDANHRLRDSHYAVAHSQRAVKDAYLAVNDAAAKMNATQKNAQREFNKLSPGQQEFVLAMEEFKKTYTKYIAPITDTIIGAFSRGLRGANKLMRDPEIRGNLQRLADEIADVGDKFTKWVISPEGRRTINFFIREASRNLPKIAEAAGNFALALVHIGEAAAPVFDRIVDSLDSISKKFKEATRESEKFSPDDKFHHREQDEGASGLDKFFNESGKHLTAWGRLTAAVGNFFKALVGAAAPEGLKMVQGMTRFFNRMADAIERNPKKVGAFFKNVREGLQELLPTLGKFALTLINIFTSKEMIAFTQFILLSVIPAILHVIQFIGLLIRFFGFLVNGIDKLLGVPVISTVGKWVIGFTLMLAILQKIFPFLKIFNPVMTALGKAVFFVGRAFAGFLIANPWVALILGIIAAVIILDRHFHFIRPTIHAVQKALRFVFEWAKDHWKLLVAILLGPFGLVAGAILKWKNKIIGFFEGIINWLRTNWRTVAKVILSIFAFPVGLIALGILKWHDEIIKLFKSLPRKIINALKALPGMVVDLFKNVGKKIADEILSFIPGPLRGAAGKALGYGKSLFKKAFAVGGEIGGTEGHAVPIIAHAGEWVVNKAQQYKLAAKLGASVDTISMMLFGSKGRTPSARGSKASGSSTTFANGVELIPHTDDYGVQLWWLKLANGEFAQVSATAAKRIQSSGGTWFPNYINRAHGGPFMKSFVGLHEAIGYKAGGVVSFRAPGVQSFASGGIIGGPVRTSPSQGGNTVNQEFNVKTEGVTDWHHVMRLSAQHAQGSL